MLRRDVRLVRLRLQGAGDNRLPPVLERSEIGLVSLQLCEKGEGANVDWSELFLRRLRHDQTYPL